MSKWIRKGDKVVVISGNDKGKIGEVLSRMDDRVVVQGVNIRKKHAKKKTQVSSTGIVESEFPVHISNVNISSSKDKPVKLKVRFKEDGSKELFYIENGEPIFYRQVSKILKK